MSKSFVHKPSLLAGAIGVLVASLSCAAAAQDPVVFDRIADVAARVASPPPDARPLVRWWWFGPAVVPAQLEREIAAMKAGGFGGFEIQPVYPMELDDAARGIRNVPYLSTEFLDAVSFANRQGRAQGLRVDITLGSGWPFVSLILRTAAPYSVRIRAASRATSLAISVSRPRPSSMRWLNAAASVGSGSSMKARSRATSMICSRNSSWLPSVM